MMGTMSKSGNRWSHELKLVCDHKCRKPFRFVQQSGWDHHFLPLCDCKDHKYFVIPDYINKSQYRQYMRVATTNKNKVYFIGEGWVDEE